ncbi:MAG TPA: RidA family protein [Kiloniellales bacterium]|jgi:enamine deaminase RidA (YjgF/YER057c/UK114 family)|nr:RidA family protein [Kiloniellales bacterium]
MAGKIDARLAELSITLPTPAAPVANYVPFVKIGNLVFLSGQLPIKDGKPSHLGKAGGERTAEEAQEAARNCAINIIAQLKAACDGDLDRVKRIVRLGGFVASTPDFTDQPKVINGASDLMVEVFGDAGRHCRTAVAAPSLPMDVTVEIDGIAEIE